MAAPYPPQGAQKQQTERPLKVYAEQYVTGQPLPIGAVLDPFTPPIAADGRPWVLTAQGWRELTISSWVISNRYTGAAIEVISAEEFAERFGPSTE